ncbi:MAG TPA: homoserine O-acetyltransferase [Firmicutes bacterium]|nr:homoserine O-acetyltransferase [Bacillota bacterium]
MSVDQERLVPWEQTAKVEVRFEEIIGKPALRLDCGKNLGKIVIAYETFGELAPDGSNAVLIAHALTGDSHVTRGDSLRAGWWEDIVGPGKAIDTRKYYVVCSNVLGGCSGSTGPCSPHPKDGRPYAMRFPPITIRDMVRAERLLLQRLGIRRLRLVAGGSMGGMQALEWAVMAGDFVDNVIAIAAPGAQQSQAIAFNEVMRRAIMLDPAWRDGWYSPDDAPRLGLGLARMVGMITYHSHLSMDMRFGRERVPGLPDGLAWAGYKGDPVFQVEKYLHHQAEKIVKRFDANSYIYLTRAMDLFDIGEGRGGMLGALRQIKARLLLVGISSDILYPASLIANLYRKAQSVGVDAHFALLRSPHGHDAFLLDTKPMSEIIEDFMRKGGLM